LRRRSGGADYAAALVVRRGFTRTRPTIERGDETMLRWPARESTRGRTARGLAVATAKPARL